MPATCRLPVHSRGLTLIEVLVVAAIIALLVAVLVPSLSRARANSRSTQCLSQLRQVVVAIGEYAAEWKEVYPRAASPNEVHWTRLIARIFGEKANYSNINQLNVERFEPFHCPERVRSLPHPFVDYVVNALRSEGPHPVSGAWEEVKYSKLSECQRPAAMVYIMDAEYEELNTEGAACLSLQTARINWKEGRWRDPAAKAIDAMDIWMGEQVPQGFDGSNVTDGPGPRRAARRMHLGRWTDGGFLDGHAEGMQLENRGYLSGPNGNYAAWLRRFGVREEKIPFASTILK